MNTIKPLTSIPSISTSSGRHSGQQQTHKQMVVGEIFKATVVGSRVDNHFILDIAGAKIPVSSQSSLAVGQVLQLQVSQTSPHTELQIISDSGNLLAGKSLTPLGNSIDMAPLVSILQQGNPPSLSTLTASSAQTLSLFVPTDIQSILNSTKGGDLLHILLNRLGINFETLLARGKTDNAQHTLKAALLEIISRFRGSEQIAEHAGKLLASLELYQLSQLQLSNQNITIFPLPLPLLEHGYLLIDNGEPKDKETAESQKQHIFSLHLTMGELGNIQIDFIQDSEALFIKLIFDSEEKAQFASQFSGMLEEMLSVRSDLSVSFSSGAENPASHLAKMLLPDGTSFINTTA